MKTCFSAVLIASSLLLLSSCDSVNNADNPTNNTSVPASTEQPQPSAMQDAGMTGAPDTTDLTDTSR